MKPITANRTRQRIERVLDAAKALKLRSGENPAAWRGNLKHGDEAELSYWTSEMIERRREALQAWADYIKRRKADLTLVTSA